MGGKSLVLVICSVFSLLVLSSPAGAYSFYAHTSKLIYTTGENLSVTGNITNYMSQINMTLTISNSTPITVTTSSLNMSGSMSGSNIFSFSQSLSGVPVGAYNASVTDGAATIFMNFEVVSQITYLEAHLINAQDIIPVSTSAIIVAGNETTGGNFTELRALSKSGTIHYGSVNITGKPYYFVLVDQNYNLTYDTLYVDDDSIFQLYNDSEDTGNASMIERVLEKGDRFGDYMVGEIEFNAGNKVVLGKPGTSVFSQGSTVNFIVMAKDSNKNLIPNVTVQARLLNSSKGVISSLTNTTNEMGFFISNFTAPSVVGSYTIDLNNSKGTEFFTVESFKLIGKVTDLSDNPANSFTPNSVARIYASSRDSGGNAVNLTSGTVRITYPNGNTVTSGLTQSETGVYYYDFSTGSITGNYGVKVSGSYGGSTQEFITGFSVESVSLQIMAMNMRFIDQAESGAGEVNAFAPQDNVTLMVFLSNISAGGMMSKGPEGMGLIDIDNSSTGTDECGTLVSLVELRDDRGISVDVSSALIVNLSRAISMAGISLQEQPPQEVMRQCVIIFAAPNRTGTYKAVAQIDYNNEIKKAGSNFGIQRLFAEGASVDSKGDDYWFFAPNTTMKIKLKIKDLSTREDLPPQNITGAKIIEIYKEFPDYQDVFTASFRVLANESVQNGTLVFNAPDAEGFFSMKFKFKAYVNGAMEEGIGNAFFQLKKYMIWATPQCSQEGGQCISGLNKSVTLTVNVVDIDQGSMMSQMGKGTSSLTCTGCEGLVVDVGSLRNDQLMKEMVKGVDFNVSVGMVANATTNITIIPLSPKMQSGWYGMDLIVTDLADTDNTYFGWGGFEVRNFYVETMKITDNGTALFVSRDMGPVFEKGGSAAFALVARDPSTGDMLSISSATLQSIKWMAGWPPTEISTDSVATSVSNSTRVYAEWLPPEEVWYPYVVNITGLDKDGEFQADARVTTSKGSDIGSFFFGLSTYNIEISYRGMDEWKSPFSSSENLTVTFTAMDFGDPPQPHNLSQAGSKLRAIYNDKTGTPIRINTSITNCTGNACIISTPLSSLSSGWYSGEYSINDTDGYEKTQKVYFMVQNLIVGIPSIEEAWVGNQDTASKDVDIGNDRDRCDNSIGIMWMGPPDTGDGTGTFCVQSSGEWRQGSCTGSGVEASVWANSSVLMVNNVTHLVGGYFVLGGKNWTVVSAGQQPRLNLSNNTICGEMSINCGMEGCEQVGYMMASPGSHTTFYHGRLDSLVSENQYNGRLSGNQTRPLYFYHNTSYLWVSTNTSNMTQLGGPYTVGGTFNDSYGGQWKVNSISKNKINIVGLNVLAGSGAYINVSKSKSGVIKIGWLEEFRLGGWDKQTGNQRGLDLDNDSLTNGTVYIAISDSQTAGIYDTFFFFNATGNNAFSTALSVSDPNVNNRKFGLNNSNRVTLLSIDPRADRVRFYSDKMGDWADLGDFRMDGNVSIPIIVRSPNGSSASANASINNIRVKGSSVNRIFSLPGSVPNATITGAGEVRIVNIGQYSLGSGEYVFEVRATVGQNSEMLEEWKWPRASPRTFLVDGYTGQAAYVSGFRQFPITRYDGETYEGEIKELYTANWTQAGKYYKAVLAFISGNNQIITYNSTPVNLSACNFMAPPGAGSNNNNVTLMSSELRNPQYYFYMTASNASKVWIKQGSCNFSDVMSATNVSDAININNEARIYYMRLLDADMDNRTVVIGINNSQFSDDIEPLRMSTWGGDQAASARWRIMSINVNGTTYNAILSNSSDDYPMCAVWNMQECAKKAWLVNSSNFSQAVGVKAGENFTDYYYLTKVGPGPWDGVSIADFSSMTDLPRPAVDVRVKSSTTSYYGIFNESSLNLDINMDGDKTDVFYAVAYDDMDDGTQNLTQIVVDDDTNITEEWWSESTNQSLRKDFYSSETGMVEKRSSLPNSIWQGNIWFGEQTNGSWEQQPQWRIEKYNNTDMLLLKDEWQINGTRNMTILLRAYNFNQSAIVGANVSVSAIKGNMGMGFIKLNQGEHYNMAANVSATNSDGYAILTIIPQQALFGEYMVDIQTTYNGNTETTNKWFRVI